MFLTCSVLLFSPLFGCCLIVSWGANSGRTVKSNWFLRRAQRPKILSIEGTERGFNGGAEPSYSIAHAPSQQRNPHARTDKQSGRTRRGWTPRVRFIIQLGSLKRCGLVHFFCRHLT